MTKPLLAAVLILFALMFASVAFATGGHVPIIVKPPVVVAPPPPSVAVPPPSPAAAPQPQPSGGGSGSALGWYVMGGVAIYFYLVICEREKYVNPQGWFAQHCVIPFRD